MKPHRKDGFYNSKEWYKIRAIVLKRDRYRCRFCGRSVNGKGLSRVDHIKKRVDYPELSLDANNLQVLCSKCHESVKTRDEANPNRGCNPDGTPIDPNNEWNLLK